MNMKNISNAAGSVCLCLAASISLLCVALATADDNASKEETGLTQWSELRVVIKDEAGKPVTGAAVKAYEVLLGGLSAHYCRRKI